MLKSSNTTWLSANSNVLFATLLSVLVHVVSAYSYLSFQIDRTDQPGAIHEKPFKISFTTIPAKQEPQPEPLLENPIEPAPVAKAEPEQVNDTKPERVVETIAKKVEDTKPKPEPAAKPAMKKQKPKPEKAFTQAKPEEIEKKHIDIAPEEQTASLPLIVVEENTKQPSDNEIKELYITQLLNQIEKNKFYPRKARRRNIEGTVKVKISINAEGKIISMTLSDGHKILRKATEKAIKQAVPLPRPPIILGSTETVSFGITYRFTDL